MKEERLELTGKCVSCFAPNGVLINYGGDYDYMCPKCAQYYDLYELAGEHLKEFLPVALQAWREHWLERGVTPLGLADVFDSVAADIFAEMKQEGIEARDASKEAGSA